MLTGENLIKMTTCPVCKQTVQQPKILGPCLHTCCLDCIRRHIDLLSPEESSFLCPVCHGRCPLPKTGTDALADNYILHNLAGKSRREFRTVREGVSESPMQTSQIQHSPPLVADDVCTTHGKRLKKFCRTCNELVCRLCAVANHSGGTHVVKSAKKVEEDTSAALSKMNKMAEASIAKAKREEEELHKIANEVANRRRATKMKVQESLHSALEKVEERLTTVSAEIYELYRQLTKLEQERDSLVKMKEGIHFKHEELVAEVDWECAAYLDRIQTSLTELLAIEQRLEINKLHSETLKSSNLLSGGVQECLGTLRTDLTQVTTAFDMVERAESCQVCARKIRNFVPDKHGHGVGKLDPSSYPGDMSLSFSLRLCTDNVVGVKRTLGLTFPKCESVRSLVQLPDGRVAALGRNVVGTSKFLKQSTVYMWSPPSESVHRLTHGRINSAKSLTLNEHGEFVMVREGDGVAVSILNAGTGDVKNISVTGWENVDSVKCIAQGAKGKLFVVYENSLAVLSDSGSISETFYIGNHNRIAFYRPTEKIFTCNADEITQHGWFWGKRTVKDWEHGVDGFRITDIACGLEGQLFVAGTFGEEARVYQVFPELDYVWRMSMVLKKPMQTGGRPRICVMNDQLAIECNGRVELYLLMY